MDFLKVREEHLELILHWRTSEHVTRYMFTDVEYNLDNQKKWFERISKENSSKYWVIKAKEQLIGLVSLNQLDGTNRRGSWAYYIGDSNFNMLGAMIGPYIYNYGFEQLGLNKLSGEVMAENEGVRKIHMMHGCREVGFYQNHIYKYGKYHDVYLYEMLASVWDGKKSKYKKYVADFEE